MIPSKFLRLIISKNHKIKLKNLAWNKDFELKVFRIKFIDGNKTLSLKTIFKDGYNIGNCLLTAYYVSSIIEDSLICTGKVEILKGTKNSPNGDHVWIETENEIIDTTLMIVIPKYHIYSKFYTKDAEITPKFRPEECNYQDEIYEKKQNITKYYTELYKTGKES